MQPRFLHPQSRAWRHLLYFAIMMARVRTRSSTSGAESKLAHVGLLRGINVGGKNLLPMANLREMFQNAGCADVRTYIQSGNVVFTAKPAVARRIPQIVSQAIFERFGFQPVVIVRTAKEIAQAAADNPFLTFDTDYRTLLVGFLTRAPDEARIAALDPKRSPGDSFRVRGREVYLHLPNGVKSKFNYAYFESVLSMPGTFRNWRTVLKLVEMTRM